MWIEHDTDWSVGDMVTYEDMNRIVGNLLTIYPTANITTREYTHNDILTRAEWEEIVSETMNVVSALRLYTDTAPGNDMTATNFNILENLQKYCYDRLALISRQAVTNEYVGQGIYVGAGHYARGN